MYEKYRVPEQIRKNNIDSHISEPDLHDQNHVEGFIREVRRKWCRAMIRKQVPTKLWDCGMRCYVNDPLFCWEYQ